ncbi:Uncharacterised protein [uncultured archaeon]|nr:Uncharacterised protein [uncultured archaeon]
MVGKALGYNRTTACARAWLAECQNTSLPPGESNVSARMEQSRVILYDRSTACPSISAASEAERRRFEICPIASAAVAPAGTSIALPSGSVTLGMAN